MKYCYSHDEESYTGSFDTREAALTEARADDAERTVWTAEILPASKIIDGMDGFRVGDLALEHVNEDLYEEITVDDGPLEYTAANASELGRVILDWIAENLKPTTFRAENVVEHQPDPRP